MEQIFEWTYVWVNKGEWRSSSVEESAIKVAKYEAIKNDIDIYELKRINIDIIPCSDSHKDVCAHLKVTLYK